MNMRKRIVIWGSDENDDKALLALELMERENKVQIFLFSEKDATEVFYTQMMNMWRDGQEVIFPESTRVIERDLSVSDDLLPENIRVDRPDIISLAKTQWHFIVLSNKLYSMYKSELEDMKEKIDRLVEFEDPYWEELKTFWTKISDQLKEKNIFREHAESLKNKTDECFAKLKELKKASGQKFRHESADIAQIFMDRINTINDKVENGMGLNPLFDELKVIQSEFKTASLLRKDQQNVWSNLDQLFKKIKEKRSGKRIKEAGNALNRLSKRYEGLIAAISKMEKSILGDQKEMDFQLKRIAETDGQLEAQIRQAKIKMIEETISSKKNKLDDMYRTKDILEESLKRENHRIEERKKVQEVEKAKQVVAEKIANEIAEQAEKMEEQADILIKAATDISETKRKMAPPSTISHIESEMPINQEDSQKTEEE